jgi:glycosyltransferase involved in cell wall biosynthesis
MQQMNLEWLCDSPSPYNSDLFRALAKEPSISLTVHYYRSTALASHPWQFDLTEGYDSRTSKHFLGIDWKILKLLFSPGLVDPASPLENRERLFVVAGWKHTTPFVLLTLLSLGFRKYVIWTDTPNLNRHREWAFSTLRSAWIRWILSRAYRVMGTGTPAIEALKIMGARDSQLIVFPYWIDLNPYQNPPISKLLPEIDRPFRFISIGRIVNDLKGHNLVLQALSQVNLTRKESLCEYYIIGSGADEAAIHQEAAELGLKDRVKVLGWLEPKEIIDQLARADVLIHPSPVHEPYGVVVIEGMAAGKPVLASNVTCAGLDRIEEGVNGFIHPAGDVKTIVDHLNYFLDRPEEAAKMGKEAISTAHKWPIVNAVNIIKSLFTIDIE